MKTSYVSIKMATQAISEVLQKELPVKLSLTLIRNTDKIAKELNVMQEAIKLIQVKYQTLEKENKAKGDILEEDQKKIDQQNKTDFQKEINEIMQTEIEIELQTIKLSEFGDKFTIKPASLKLLSDINIIDIESN